MKLSVAIATYNEEKNISKCLESIKNIADEIVIVDGDSSDRTVEICKKFRARVLVTQNHPIFHINKQKAFDLSKGEWVLYLDADERVTPKLANEIVKIITMKDEQIVEYQENIINRKLFLRHQILLEQRDGKIGDNDKEYVAFFFPRMNYFLGKFLRYGGVYPDGVIRLFKKNKAYLPCKNVHEQMVVLGKVGWLQNDLLHMDSPTFFRYVERNKRYINLMVEDFEKNRLKISIIQFLNYCILKPLYWFISTQIRHKGILDGYQGIIFSLFSALRFPRAYLIYIRKKQHT